jgi:hypothetical protein
VSDKLQNPSMQNKLAEIIFEAARNFIFADSSMDRNQQFFLINSLLPMSSVLKDGELKLFAENRPTEKQ